jgi:delta(3,5)-delta(2,4)-dienoyl-CoA isomerase
MWLNLKKIFDRLSLDQNVRSILLTGKGERAFTAGLDINAAAEGSTLGSGAPKADGARVARAFIQHIIEFQDCITSVEKCSKPVVVLLHGISYGLAIDLSSAADVRICTSNLRASVKEVDIGLAADIGTLSRLPRVVGNYSWVKEIAYTAREFGAEEALRVGFVSSIVPDYAAGLKRGLELCTVIAQKSPVAVWGTKTLLDYSRDHTIDEGLKYTALWNSAMLQTGDVKSALGASIQRSKPKFEKL